MIKPMPFWPSFEPWAKLTPVQVRISRQRIQNGGGLPPSGARYRAGTRMQALAISSSKALRKKPASGENTSARPMPIAWAQSTPLVPDDGDIS